MQITFVTASQHTNNLIFDTVERVAFINAEKNGDLTYGFMLRNKLCGKQHQECIFFILTNPNYLIKEHINQFQNE